MTYWYDRPHDPRPWMPGDADCRCGDPIDGLIHGTPRFDVRLLLEAALFLFAIFVLVVVTSTGYAA